MHFILTLVKTTAKKNTFLSEIKKLWTTTRKRDSPIDIDFEVQFHNLRYSLELFKIRKSN